MTGIDVSGKVIVLDELQADLIAGGVPVPNGLTIAGPPLDTPVFPPPPPGPPPPCADGSLLFTYDAQGNPADLPPAALPIIDAYTPEPAADPQLEAIKAVPLGSTTDELRDRIVDWIEARFGG